MASTGNDKLATAVCDHTQDFADITKPFEQPVIDHEVILPTSDPKVDVGSIGV